MKIQTILAEAKFAKPEYAYHATNMDNLKSILKHGLVPNYRSGGYGSEETSTAGYSLTPLTGVYFTRNATDALYIAKGLSGKNIIIVAKIQPKQVEVDEDRIIITLLGESEFLRKLRNLFGPNAPDEYADTDEFKKLITKYTNDILSKSDIGDRGNRNAFPYIANYLKNLAEFYFGYDTDETKVKESQNEVTKALRLLAHKHKNVHHTFKINTTVGFSGANRIVGIYDLTDDIAWGDIADLKGYEYHTVDNPMNILVKHRRYDTT